MGNKTKVSVIGLEGADMAMRVRKESSLLLWSPYFYTFFYSRNLLVTIIVHISQSIKYHKA